MCYINRMSNLIPRDALTNERVLTPPDNASSNTASRLNQFIYWLNQREQSWAYPSLSAYRDDLLDAGRTPATVDAYLSTIRGHYRRLLSNNTLRQQMLEAAPGDTFAERRAVVEEIYTQLENAIDPVNSRVNLTTVQDHSDDEHLRLTPPQAIELINKPGTYDLLRLRDTVGIALMLTTGVRKFELCAIHVAHLRQRLDGQLALLVPEGKGNKQRMIPYGAFEWVLPLVDHWLLRAGIDDGPVIRGFYRGHTNIRKTALTPSSVRYMLDPYKIVINGELRRVEPHDLRRTYARLLYDAGMRPEVIQQNLGHESVETTMGYIGLADAEERKPPHGILSFDVSGLLR